MSDPDGAAIGCVSTLLAGCGACLSIFGVMWGTPYWWLKGPLLLIAAFALPRVVARFSPDR